MKLFVTFLLLVSQSVVLSQQTCADIKASCHKQSMCCVDINGEGTCTLDTLICKYTPQQDFMILYEIVLIVVAFAAGIPFLIFLVNLIFCTQYVFGKSVCELLAIRIFWFVCLSTKQILKIVKQTMKLQAKEEEESDEENQ